MLVRKKTSRAPHKFVLYEPTGLPRALFFALRAQNIVNFTSIDNQGSDGAGARDMSDDVRLADVNCVVRCVQETNGFLLGFACLLAGFWVLVPQRARLSHAECLVLCAHAYETNYIVYRYSSITYFVCSKHTTAVYHDTRNKLNVFITRLSYLCQILAYLASQHLLLLSG